MTPMPADMKTKMRLCSARIALIGVFRGFFLHFRSGRRRAMIAGAASSPAIELVGYRVTVVRKGAVTLVVGSFD
jgi:hypothetical protein